MSAKAYQLYRTTARTERHVEVEARSDYPEDVQQALSGNANAGRPLEPYHPDVCASPWLPHPPCLPVANVCCRTGKSTNDAIGDTSGNQISATNAMYQIRVVVDEGSP
jgi:hypothetical protein